MNTAETKATLTKQVEQYVTEGFQQVLKEAEPEMEPMVRRVIARTRDIVTTWVESLSDSDLKTVQYQNDHRDVGSRFDALLSGANAEIDLILESGGTIPALCPTPEQSALANTVHQFLSSAMESAVAEIGEAISSKDRAKLKVAVLLATTRTSPEDLPVLIKFYSNPVFLKGISHMVGQLISILMEEAVAASHG